MIKQPLWDEYETALLIEAYIKIKDAPSSRMPVLQKLSDDLRQMAINKGLEIDETYRNLNGMSWQLQILNSVFHPIENFNHASQMFKKMVVLYQTDQKQFLQYLERAKQKSTPKNSQYKCIDDILKEFQNWFMQLFEDQVQFNLLLQNLKIANQYSINLYKDSIFNTSNVDDFRLKTEFINTPSFDSYFHSSSNNNFSNLSRACIIYQWFISEKGDLIRKTINESNFIFSPNPNSQKSESQPTEQQPSSTSFTYNASRTLSPQPSHKPQYNVEQIKQLFYTKFQNGIRSNSARSIAQFRFQAENENILLPESDAVLTDIILKFSMKIGTGIYPFDKNIIVSLQEKINQVFNEGVLVIYYESFYNKESDWLNSIHIYEALILKEFLKEHFATYDFSKVFFSLKKDLKESTALPLEFKRVWGTEAILDVLSLSALLPYIPEENVQRGLSSNSLAFIRVAPRKYFNMDFFDISTDEKETILQYVKEKIASSGFVSLAELPYEKILNKNADFDSLSILDAIYASVLEPSHYHKNGKILSLHESVDIISILNSKFLGLNEISFDEINDEVEQLNGGTKRQDSFEFLYNHYIRINKSFYVNKSKVVFETDEIDALLNNIYSSLGFGPIKNIITFALFPDCNYIWNHFLIESFLINYSKQFHLVTQNYNDKNAGFVVSNNLACSFDELITQQLVETKKDFTEETAGEYLFQIGVLTRKTYFKLPDIIKEVKKRREEATY